MKKLLIFVYIIFLNSINLSAQKETYIGLKMNFAEAEFYSYEDKGPLIKNTIYHTINFKTPEFFIGRELITNLTGELGFRYKYYTIGFHSAVDDIDRFDIRYFMFQIPFRLKYTYPLNNRFLLKPFIGFIYGIDDSHESDNQIISGSGTNDYFLTMLDQTGFEDNFFMAHLGIDMEFRIGKRHSLVFNIEYSKGYKKLVSRRLEYFTNNIEPKYKQFSSKIIGKGDYLAFGISYKYNFIAKPIRKIKTEGAVPYKKRRIK